MSCEIQNVISIEELEIQMAEARGGKAKIDKEYVNKLYILIIFSNIVMIIQDFLMIFLILLKKEKEEMLKVQDIEVNIRL